MRCCFTCFLISTGIAAAFGLYVLSETNKVYEKGETLSARLSLGWWITDGSWSVLVASSSYYNLLPLQIDEKFAWAAGLSLFIAGCILTAAGVIEFRSLRKISAMEVSKLITAGIYRWSRNPQFLGFYLSLLDLSLMGRSGYALLLSIIAIVYCHHLLLKWRSPIWNVSSERSTENINREPRDILDYLENEKD